MYRTLFLLCLSLIVWGCSQQHQANKHTDDHAHMHDMQAKSAAVVLPAGQQLALDKDPVCQMSVTGEAKLADTLTYNGKLYGFCNPGCKEEFKKTPQQFLK
jgi:YHS domain-containing protein